MEKYGVISVGYSKRNKKYTFSYPGIEKFAKQVEKILGRRRTAMLFTFKKDSLTVSEFFLLELEFIIDKLTSGDMAVKLVDIITGLMQILKYIREKTWIAARYEKFTPYIDTTRINSVMKFKPLPHQLEIYKKYEEIKHYANLRGFMIDAAAGLGKTYTSLSLAEGLDYNYIMIIAPRQVIDRVWVKSITEELYRVPQTYLVLDKKTRNSYKRERFIILHYEELDKLINNNKLLRQIRARKPMLIIDEFHNFNEVTSKRTQNLLKLTKTINFKDVVTLTGTPVKFDGPELAPLLYILDEKFPPVMDNFLRFYKNVDPITSDLILYRFNLYRKRVEKNTDMLPPITITDHRVKIPDGDKYTIENIIEAVNTYKDIRLKEILEHYDEYENTFYELISKVKSKLIVSGYDPNEVEGMFNDYIGKLRIIRDKADANELRFIPTILIEVKEFEEKNILPNLSNEDRKRFKFVVPIIKYPKFKVMGEALGKIVLGNRIACYRELAKYTDYDNLLSITPKKGLVFSNYISVCENAISKLKELKFKPLGVYGPYTKQLPEIVKKFNTLDTDYNPLVATYKSLSTGVPLTAANIVICLDIPFRLYVFDQAVSRVHRLGQDKPVFVFTIKLDTGDKVNITDRDQYILNLSKLRVELITNNKIPFNLPEVEIEKEDNTEDSKVEEEIKQEIIEDVEEEIKKELIGTPNSGILQDVLNVVTGIVDKIKILL